MDVLVYGVATAAVTATGGLWIATRPKTWLTEARLAVLVALGAGLLLATLLFEMLPTAVEALGQRAFTFFAIGIATVLLLERYASPLLDRLFAPPAGCDATGHGGGHGACEHGHHHHHHHHAVSPDVAEVATAMAHAHGHHAHGLLSHGTACTAVGCLIVCTFFDGLSLAAGFATSAQLGALLSAGLTLHLLPEGVVAASVLLAAGGSRAAAQRAVWAVAGALLAGIAAAWALGGALGAPAAVLALASGVIAYVVLGQLVPVALQAPGGLWLMLLMLALLGSFEHVWPHTHNHPH